MCRIAPLLFLRVPSWDHPGFLVPHISSGENSYYISNVWEIIELWGLNDPVMPWEWWLAHSGQCHLEACHHDHCRWDKDAHVRVSDQLRHTACVGIKWDLGLFWELHGIFWSSYLPIPYVWVWNVPRGPGCWRLGPSLWYWAVVEFLKGGT